MAVHEYALSNNTGEDRPDAEQFPTSGEMSRMSRVSRTESESSRRSVESGAPVQPTLERMGGSHLKALYCTDKLWVFVTIGLTMIVIGFLLGVIYFSIRALTTSLEHTETVPTYANAILVLCAGVLTIFLCKRRNKVVIFTMITMCVICCLVCIASGILTGIRNIQTILRIETCHYQQSQKKCDCYTYTPPYKPGNASQWVIKDSPEFVFYNSPSCEVIKTNLIEFMYTQCALYGAAVIMCLLAVVLGAVVYKNERKRMRLFKSENYDSATVISNGSSGQYRERQDIPTVSAHIDNSDNNSTSTGHTAPSLFSQRITFPGDSQPRLLGIRRNDSLVRPVRNQGAADDVNQNESNQNVEINRYSAVTNIVNNSQNDRPPNIQVPRSNSDETDNDLLRTNMENETRDRRSRRRSSQGRSESTHNLNQSSSQNVSLDTRQLRAMWDMFLRYLQQSGHTLPDYPLHRGAAADVMPNRPLTRSTTEQFELPNWPVSRNGTSNNLSDTPQRRASHPHQSLGDLRPRRGRNIATSQRNSSLRHPPHLSFVHYMTGVSNVYTYQAEPPPPYAQPPPYLETAPDYQSEGQQNVAETQTDANLVISASRSLSRHNSQSNSREQRDVVETVI